MQNHLLAALPMKDYERLLPELEPIPLPRNGTVYVADDREKYLYFPTAGLVSCFYVTGNGASAVLAVTGSEGVIGIASFLGGESMRSQAAVLSAGHAYRLHVNPLKKELAQGGPLLPVLLRYTQVLIAQTGQMALCNLHHSLEQRLCRWILSCLDRLPSNQLKMTQEMIANMLGVRREGVTKAIGKLQTAGLIHHNRSHIAVLDRFRMEAQACECYAIVKRDYDRLIPQGNTTDNAGVDIASRLFDRKGRNQPAKLGELYAA
jgi:CRP-like cAMP-binding protein